MTTQLTETAAEVAALIPKYSWEVMDEEQRDSLIKEVVLPRYMNTTADGVNTGPKFWSELVGASPEAIKKRVYRVQQSQKAEAATGTPPESEWEKKEKRSARASLRDEGKREKVVSELEDEEIADLRKALRAEEEKRRTPSKKRTRKEVEEGALLEMVNWLRETDEEAARKLDLLPDISPTGQTLRDLLNHTDGLRSKLDTFSEAFTGIESIEGSFTVEDITNA